MPHFWGGLRRLPGQDKAVVLKQWFYKQSIPRRVGLCVALYFFLTIVAYAFFGGNACAVAVNNKVVAIVADEEEAKKALGELLRMKSGQTGKVITVAEKVSYKEVRVDQERIIDGVALKEILNQTLSFNTIGYVIVINGEDRLCLKQKDEAQELFNWLRSIYPTEPGEQIAFKENVELVEKTVNMNDLLEIDAAKDLVLLGTDQIQQYIVKDGDTAWDISAAFDIGMEQLQAANPGVDTWRLSIGQVLKLSKEVPLITVVATRQATVNEEIPYEVEEKKDDTMFSGEKKIIRKGIPGQRIVTYLITRENGLETNREVREQTILSEPVSEVVVKGSQTMLASRGGSARMSRPCAGSIVSPFGKRGGRMHEGVDIGASYGSRVNAAAGGKVIAAGWEGGYGKTVQISHGNGVVTRYAHLSEIKVSVGQKVERGQIIGLVGSTGNSTGPHLHFEVIVNGQQRNPVNFLP